MAHDYMTPGPGAYIANWLPPFNFDCVWEDLCDSMNIAIPFKIKDAIGNVTMISHYTQKQQRNIIREVLLAVEAQGNKQVRRLSKLYWVL